MILTLDVSAAVELIMGRPRQPAIAAACELNHPVHDAVYLAACQDWQAALLTLDAKLATAAAKIGSGSLTWIGLPRMLRMLKMLDYPD